MPAAGEGMPDDSERNPRVREEVANALAGGEVARVQVLPPSRDELEREHLQQDLELKKRYGRWLLWLVTAQLVVADLLFTLYFIVGAHWDPPEGVMYAWLTTTLVELVGVVTVVTRYLFPRRDQTG
jgi:hypothetical protein